MSPRRGGGRQVGGAGLKPGWQVGDTCWHILVIDDEEVVRDFARLALERHGHQVTTAASGAEGVTLFANQPDTFSAVLLDVLLPDLRGAEVLPRLREARADIPVLFSSGFEADRALDADVRELPRIDFIGKPYLADELIGKLRGLLEA